MEERVLEDIFAHAKECYPKECCGLLTLIDEKISYSPCRNISSDKRCFMICPQDYADAEDTGTILKIVHSHCDQNVKPSQADLISCERSKIPWIIVSYPRREVYEFAPKDCKVPLIGRVFIYGVVDCYSLVQDYYRQELNIDLMDHERKNDWWRKGDNLYVKNFSKAGFVQIEKPEKHAAILMQVGAPVPNHAAIYLGDNIILHHIQKRLSCKDVYGGYWRKNTNMFLKYMGKNA